MTTTEDRVAWRGKDLYAADEDKVGRIEEIYLDEETGRPEWALVMTGMLGTKQTFVPIADARADGDRVLVSYEKSLIKDAPGVEADGQLSQTEEAELYRHYGKDYSEQRSDTGLPEGDAGRDHGEVDADAATTDRGTVGDDVSGPETDQAMTRSEEELRVGTTQRESGRVRLRKHVVTDEVTKTVPVQREEIRIEREPITEANLGAAGDGPAISEEEHEVVLHEEEVVVEKRAVPKERIRLDKETEVEEQTVSEQVRKEEIEVDDDLSPRDAADRR